jgi:hypothetical protein
MMNLVPLALGSLEQCKPFVELLVILKFFYCIQSLTFWKGPIIQMYKASYV